MRGSKAFTESALPEATKTSATLGTGTPKAATLGTGTPKATAKAPTDSTLARCSTLATKGAPTATR